MTIMGLPGSGKTLLCQQFIFARATATGGAEPVWVRHDGTALTAEELGALQRLFNAVGRFFDFTTDLLDPMDELIE